jgi:Kef-type K+ transport system membrane component KefB
MRRETIAVWIFVGFGLLMLGTFLYVLGLAEGAFARLLAGVGIVYFGIGIVLSVMHDRHMARRTQAGNDATARTGEH